MDNMGGVGEWRCAWPVSVLAALLVCGGCLGCASGTDSVPADVREDIVSTDVPVADLGIPEDATDLRKELPDVATTYSLSFQPAGYVTDQPVLFLVESPAPDPGTILLGVYGRQLGTVAGVAFYLEYDPARVEPVDFLKRADFGSGAAVSTEQIAGVLRPGVISYGGARFCDEKNPWESTSCGGVPILNATEFLSVRFKALAPGDALLSLPSSSVLVRAGDYASVPTVQVGGTLRVSEVTP